MPPMLVTPFYRFPKEAGRKVSDVKPVSKQVQSTLHQQEFNSEGYVHPGQQRSHKDNETNFGMPLPRPKRRRKRSKADRGLPNNAELALFATAYLEKQRKHWPKFAEAGLLPMPSSEVIHRMVEDFKDRHRGTVAKADAVQPFKALCSKLAGLYNRFSCDNSNPTSISDQMANALDKAKAEERFIPWEYVYADFSVTGLNASRQGYSSYKDVLRDRSHLVETTYIDDFTRASRDELEWWKLAALSKRMIGASDGFDLHRSDWDIQITLFGLVSRLFLKGLREKVRRGMGGAAERGTCLGKLSLGFTRRQKCDTAGNPMIGADQLPIYEPVIDPQTSPDRVQMFRLFVEQNWSTFKIARDFNERQVDGWDRWNESGIRKLLWSPSAIGVFIWNRAHRDYDWEEEKWVKVANPHSLWKVKFRRELATVPLELWRAARRKLAAMRRADPRTGKKLSRNENCATTLFSGTLFCGDCGEELKLIRSSEYYKQMGCLNGYMHSASCQFRASKSVHIIEDCLLGYLRDQLLTESVGEQLVARANQFIAEQAIQPCLDTCPLKAQVKQLQTKIERLVKKVAETDDVHLSGAYHQNILQFQREVNHLKATIRAEEARLKSSVQPIKIDQANAYLRHRTVRRDILHAVVATCPKVAAASSSICFSKARTPNMKMLPTIRIRETLRKMAAAHAAAMAASEEAMRLLSAEFEAITQPQVHTAFSQTPPTDRPVIDRATLSVLFKGRSCFLGNTLPFRLLDRLLRRPNQFVSYEQLQDDVWNSMPSPESIRSVVKELRRKLRCAGMDGLANAIDGKVARHYSLTLVGVS